ncbi:MAG: MBOAT family O-acyltransferase [Flavipsychrobacter sp.]
MLFNSIQFLVFLPIVVLCYYKLAHKYRWILLFVASCYFYASFIPEYLFILLGIILIDFFAAKAIARTVNKKKKKRYLLVSILATCCVLFVFKYFNFFSENVNALASFIGWNYSVGILKWALPIGLSFHTFQSLSYVIEVYWGKQEPEKHLGIYATYVMFFPQLVAGPIERPQNLIPQFKEKHPLLYKNLSVGFRIALLGFFKKMVIADNLALYVNEVFYAPDYFGGNMAILGAYFFVIQVYCDFSGYSDIAIGVARMMGFKLMVNFRQPLFSTSIIEFWRRWHISLSTWFRDYIYIPLGGNRVKGYRIYFNLFVVFLISGVWHGAGWTYIIFGALQAAYISLEVLLLPITKGINAKCKEWKLSKWCNALAWIITFHFVVLSFVVFRASDMQNAIDVFHAMSFDASTFISQLQAISEKVHAANLLRIPVLFLLVSLALFWLIDLILFRIEAEQLLDKTPKLVRWLGYYTIIAWILFFGMYETAPKFIYFQF